jgi:hypothetical protein
MAANADFKFSADMTNALKCSREMSFLEHLEELRWRLKNA